MRSALAAAGLAATVVVAAGASAFQSTTQTCTYRGGGALPDPACTPGALNPAVTQATIHSTICVRGYTATIRPPVSVTEKEKYKAMAAYGIPKGTSARLFELDHRLPLEAGGAADGLSQLWPEYHSVKDAGRQEGSFVKDALENRMHALVCSGKVTLAQAQAVFLGDWTAGYVQYVGPLPK